MTTKSVMLERFHSIESIQIIDVSLPEMQNDAVEVNVHYCGINFSDIYQICALTKRSVPFTLGIECSGIVTSVGSQVGNDFQIGDKVICYDYEGGMHQQTLRINCKQCYKLPDGIDLRLAAAIFVNYLTAWFALFSIGNISENQTIFVDSGAGGVGSAVINLVKHCTSNVRIVSTCSESKRNLLEDNGVVWASHNALSDIEDTFDLIIESQSPSIRNILMAKLNPFGKCVIIGAKALIDPSSEFSSSQALIDPTDLIFGNRVVAGLHIGIIRDQHPALFQQAIESVFALMVKHPAIAPVVEVLPFHDAQRGFQMLKCRQNIGKIVLQCRGESQK